LQHHVAGHEYRHQQQRRTLIESRMHAEQRQQREIGRLDETGHEGGEHHQGRRFCRTPQAAQRRDGERRAFDLRQHRHRQQREQQAGGAGHEGGRALGAGELQENRARDYPRREYRAVNAHHGAARCAAADAVHPDLARNPDEAERTAGDEPQAQPHRHAGPQRHQQQDARGKHHAADDRGFQAETHDGPRIKRSAQHHRNQAGAGHGADDEARMAQPAQAQGDQRRQQTEQQPDP